MRESVSVTCRAPVNIAVVKYWGKRCEERNLPLNSSVSVTLDADDLCANTTVSLEHDCKEDTFSLNGVVEPVASNKRLLRCLKAVRHNPLKKKVNGEDQERCCCRIISSNNFPTAAGLASSAAGYACLAKCLTSLYPSAKDPSLIARLGSGSACRSMYGGFVKWTKGEAADGTDSKVIQIADERHWPELKILILVVSGKEKPVGSTEGMRRSVETSQLLQHRVNSCVEKHCLQIEEAIAKRDFEMFAQVTMKESNQLHAICQDTFPPIRYMNDISHHIVSFITRYNQPKLKAAYTFDAGPNAVLFTLEENLSELLATILKYFPRTAADPHFVSLPSSYRLSITNKSAACLDDVPACTDVIDRIICTQVGAGAEILPQ